MMAKGRKTGGRQRGTQNKMTVSLKGAIEGAFTAAVEPVIDKEPIDIVDVAKRIALVLALAEDKMTEDATPLLRGSTGSNVWVV